MEEKKSLFEELGGRPQLMKIVKHFYDKVYAHPWLGLYFKNTPQEHIENQQADFMTGALGGPKIYAGRSPNDAHPHLFITEELYVLRTHLMMETLKELNVPQAIIDRWIKIEDAFKASMVKTSIDQCHGRYKTEEILAFENPEKIKKAS